MKYCDQIKKIRQELLVTQEELAAMLHVTFATINRWERGHHEPGIRQRRKIKDFCKEKDIDWEAE